MKHAMAGELTGYQPPVVVTLEADCGDLLDKVEQVRLALGSLTVQARTTAPGAMPGERITVEGALSAETVLGDFQQMIRHETEAIVDKGAHDVQKLGRSLAPQRTGELRSSIQIDGPYASSSSTVIGHEPASFAYGKRGAPRAGALTAAAYARRGYITSSIGFLNKFTARIGPMVVYGRIRELGGRIPGRRTVMDHPYLRWRDRNVNWVFWNVRKKGPVQQRGVHYMENARKMVMFNYRADFEDRVAVTIRSI